MGVRLAAPAGAALKHNARGSEIVSDATAPGSIQVPGNGLPIIQIVRASEAPAQDL